MPLLKKPGLWIEEEVRKKVERSREDEQSVGFVTTYNPRLANISKILKENWKLMIESDGRLAEAFPKPPMVCFKRPPNIKDLLCWAKLSPKRNFSTRPKKPGFRRCSKDSCRMCPYTGLDPGQVKESITFGLSGEVIPIKRVIRLSDG